MSEMPQIGGRAPITVDVEAGKSYWWCACGRLKEATVLRRFAQGDRLHAYRVQARKIREGLVLRLQAFGEKADVRREP